MTRISIPIFPNSIFDQFYPTSPETPDYNCIAWAYGVQDKFFWPIDFYYWPTDIRRAVEIDCFIELFEGIGYRVCDTGNFESGFEKIAIYADNNGTPTHAARQLQTGLWTSKLGSAIDVSHTIFSMDGGFYGSVSVFMRRPF